MPPQIPARNESIARKKRIGARLRLRWIENELGLATFLLHRVVARNRNLRKRLPVVQDATAEDRVVGRVSQERQDQQ